MIEVYECAVNLFKLLLNPQNINDEVKNYLGYQLRFENEVFRFKEIKTESFNIRAKRRIKALVKN